MIPSLKLKCALHASVMIPDRHIGARRRFLNRMTDQMQIRRRAVAAQNAVYRETPQKQGEKFVPGHTLKTILN
jgi:hypothetical protein